MSDIIILHSVNFGIQIIFDILLKIIKNPCKNLDDKNLVFSFFTFFFETAINSSFKIFFYLLSSIILLVKFKGKTLINSVLLFFSFFIYIIIYYNIQFFGC